MSKKFGKLLLLTAVAGAAAYGTYAYLQKKEQPASDAPIDDVDEDFDDFSEDLDEDLNTTKERAYVPLNLEKAEAFATEAFQKAKEVITDSVQQVKETVKSVTESQNYHSNFTDLTSNKEPVADVAAEETILSTEDIIEEEIADPVEAAIDAVEDVAETVEETVEETVKDTVEEFFDDEDDVDTVSQL